jgi:hypothetical protein
MEVLTDLMVQLLGADVAAGGEEGAHDPLSLAGALEAGAGQEVGEAADAGVGIGHGIS